MVIEGIKLAIIGMSVVFLFLALLVALIAISTRLLKPITEKERLAITTIKSPRKRMPVASDQSNGRILAVVSAALAAHRSRRKKG
jgi:sodium pump decarboxylase gamma subunit